MAEWEQQEVSSSSLDDLALAAAGCTSLQSSSLTELLTYP